MGLVEWLIDNVLAPRGGAMPAGSHLAYEGGFAWSASPTPHVTFKFPLTTSDDEPLGSFRVVADDATRFVVDDIEVSMDEVLESYGEHFGFIRLEVDSPGHLQLLQYDTRT